MQTHSAPTACLILLAQVVHFLAFSGLALLLPLIRDDLGITFAQAGALSVAATLTYALAQIPAGFACDSYGAKRLFVAGLLGWSLAVAAIAAASSYALVLAALAIGGICRALLFTPGLSLMSSCFPRDRRATAMSVYLVGSFVGTVTVSLTAPALTGSLGWRGAFVLYALLGIAISLAFAAFGRERSAAAPGSRPGRGDFVRLARHPIMWVCAALQLVRFAAAMSFNFWLPSLLVSDRGFSLPAAGAVVAATAIAAAAANPLGGYISDRLRNPPLVIGASLAVIACTSALVPAVQSVPALLAVVTLHSIFMTLYFGPLFLVPVETLGQRTAGLATGMANLWANLGALAAAWGLGFAKDLTGSFAAGFRVLAVVCVIGVVLAVVLARLRRSALRPARRATPLAQPT